MFLGGPDFWWKQVELAESVVSHKTTVCVSCNSAGKDYCLARLILWWLYTRPGSLVFVTGPSQTVLGTVLWKEIRRAAANAPVDLGLRVSTGPKSSPLLASLGQDWCAIGLSTTSVERASGQHNEELLVVVEEASAEEMDASGAPEAIRGLNPAKLILIGNPLRPEGWFYRLAQRAARERDDPSVPPAKRVNVVKIRAADSPDIHLDRSKRGLADRGFLEEAERDYGRDSLWWLSHVDAEFPDSAHGLLFKPYWVERLAGLIRASGQGGPPRLGCDLGEGTGRDSTALFVVDDLGILWGEESNRVGIPEAAQQIYRLTAAWGVRQEHIVYDAGGRGKDLPRYLAQYRITEAVPYHGGGKGGPRFLNRRSAVAWRLRQRLDPERPPELIEPYSAEREEQKRSPFYVPPPEKPPGVQPGFSLPAERSWWPRLEEELKALRYSMQGPKIALEPKEDMAKRLGRSPDLVDALLMTFALAGDY